jgi:hypothetical protein
MEIPKKQLYTIKRFYDDKLGNDVKEVAVVYFKVPTWN